MVYSVKTNLVPLVQNLVNAIQPFAEGNFVRLHFESSGQKIEVSHHPESILSDLTRLICRIITLTPQDYEVKVHIPPFDSQIDQSVRIGIFNTGVNLFLIRKGIVAGMGCKISVTSLSEEGTRFEVAIPVNEREAAQKRVRQYAYNDSRNSLSPFYSKLKRHLISHFTNIDNLEKAVNVRNQRDGVFLKKVNAVILAHLDQEGFDMITLAKAMALSRTQLHRRLKSLIGFAPARYIRYVRLQRAKEWLEKEDVTVSEVAFRTGFINLSHFTRAFRSQFGFNPSELRRDYKKGGMNLEH